MGAFLSRRLFPRSRDLTSYGLLLDSIEAALTTANAKRSAHHLRHRQLVRSLILYSTACFGLLLASIFVLGSGLSRGAQAAPVVSLPLAVWLIKRAIDGLYERSLKHDGQSAEETAHTWLNTRQTLTSHSPLRCPSLLSDALILKLEKQKAQMVGCVSHAGWELTAMLLTAGCECWLSCVCLCFASLQLQELMEQTDFTRTAQLISRHQKQQQQNSSRQPQPQQKKQQQQQQQQQQQTSTSERGVGSSLSSTPPGAEKKPAAAAAALVSAPSASPSLSLPPPALLPGQPYLRPSDLSMATGRRSVLDRVMDGVLGDGPSSRFALVCSRCFTHNGLLRPEDAAAPAGFRFRCSCCNFINGPQLPADWRPPPPLPTAGAPQPQLQQRRGRQTPPALDDDDGADSSLFFSASAAPDERATVESPLRLRAAARQAEGRRGQAAAGCTQEEKRR
jgi:hypothetical protein